MYCAVKLVAFSVSPEMLRTYSQSTRLNRSVSTNLQHTTVERVAVGKNALKEVFQNMRVPALYSRWCSGAGV